MKRQRVREITEEEKDIAIEQAIAGEHPELLGKKLRPVTLTTIAILVRSGNSLVKGVSIDNTAELLLDCLKFIVIQSRPLKDVLKLLKDPDLFEAEAWKEGDALDASEAESLIYTCAEMLRIASSTKVKPESTVETAVTADDLEDALNDGSEDGVKKNTD